MSATRASLLIRAGQGVEEAWQSLMRLYRPWIQHWLKRGGLPQQELEDLTQEVLLTLVRELPGFQHNGRVGAFRAWLRTITVNRARLYWRQQGQRPRLAAHEDFQQLLDNLESPGSALSAQWDREHDVYVLRGLLGLLELEFEPSTRQAFRRQVLDGLPARQVAEELNISPGAVYVARSRILARLRELGAGLLDPEENPGIDPDV